MAQNIVELNSTAKQIPTKEELARAQAQYLIATRIAEKVEFYRRKHLADENK